MNKNWVLFKLSFRQITHQLSGMYKGKKYGSLFVCLPLVLMLGLSGFYTWTLLVGLPKNFYFFIPFLMIFASELIVMSFGFYHTQGYLFDFRDFDLLFSMPLTKTQILAQKLISLMVMMGLYSFILTGPMVLIYGLQTVQSGSYYLIAVVGFLFMPIVPLVISSLLAVAIRFFSSKTKHRTLIRNILTVGLIVVVLMASMLLPSMVGRIVDVTGLLSLLECYVAPVYWYAMALVQQDFTYLIQLVVFSTLVLVAFLLCFNQLWAILNEKEKQKTVDKKAKLTIRSTPLFKALLKKEIKRFFSSTILMMNTLVGPIMVLVFTVGILIQKDTILLLFTSQGIAVDRFENPFSALVMLVILFSTLLCTMTACSISLEGKNFWIVRSLPISTQDYLGAKIVTNMLLCVPIHVVCLLILSVVLKFTPSQVVICLLLSVLSAIVVSLVGLVSNLHFPKFDYDREVMVVKQSMSVLIAILFGMILIAGLAMGAIFVPISFTSYSWLVLFGLSILALGLWCYLRKNAEKLLSLM